MGLLVPRMGLLGPGAVVRQLAEYSIHQNVKQMFVFMIDIHTCIQVEVVSFHIIWSQWS